MNKIMPLVSFAMVVAILALTNPSSKADYVENIAFQTYRACSNTYKGLHQNPFEKLFWSPLEIRLYQLWINSHTRQPNNLMLMTVFRTHSPALDAIGIGLGGHIFTLPIEEIRCL